MVINTILGTPADSDKCIILYGQYHVKERDAFIVDGTYKSILLDRIYYNNEEDKYKLITNMTVSGIVDYNKGQLKEFIMGKFELNFEKYTQLLISGGNKYYISKSLLERIPTLYSKRDDCYVYKSLTSNSYLSNPGATIPHINDRPLYDYSFRQEYSASKLLGLFTSVQRSPTDVSLNPEHLSLLDQYSYGLEFETHSGYISECNCMNLGLMPLKDGSIRGHEYTTIPLLKRDGFNLLDAQLKKLNSQCTISNQCSLHLHIGGFPIRSQSVFALYKLGIALQDDIVKYFPKSIFKTSAYKEHNKDYCQKLPSFKDFNEYYRYLSGGLDYPKKLTFPHPQDEREERKWDVGSRYLWLNLNKMCFGKTGKTVEFRIHPPSLNREKITNWIFTCVGILKYALLNEDSLLLGNNKITLMDILKKVYPESIYIQLYNYYNKREIFFKRSYELGDIGGAFDAMEDAESSYGTSLLYK